MRDGLLYTLMLAYIVGLPLAVLIMTKLDWHTSTRCQERLDIVVFVIALTQPHRCLVLMQLCGLNSAPEDKFTHIPITCLVLVTAIINSLEGEGMFCQLQNTGDTTTSQTDVSQQQPSSSSLSQQFFATESPSGAYQTSQSIAASIYYDVLARAFDGFGIFDANSGGSDNSAPTVGPSAVLNEDLFQHIVNIVFRTVFYSNLIVYLLALVLIIIILVFLLINGPHYAQNLGHQYITRIRSPGLSNEQVQDLPRMPYWRQAFEQQVQCSICLENFEDKQEIIVLPQCEHIFHVPCITQWLLKNETCPYCRQNVTRTQRN